MREKLETLSLAQLRQIAKDLEIKSITGKKKAELIESIIEENKAREDSASQDAEGAVKETPTYQAPARQEGYQRRGAPSQEGFQRRSAAALEGTMRKPSFSGASAQRGQAPVSAPRGAASASASRAPASAAEPRQPSVAPNINPEELQNLDSGIPAHGILEVMPDGFGFIRCENYMPGDNDVYVSPSQIRRFNLKTGDIVSGSQRVKTSAEKFAALLYVSKINGLPLGVAERRPNFEDLTPIFPNDRIHLEMSGGSISMRIVDLLSPIGKGQRGMIASQPKAGKTTLLKEIAKAVTRNHRDMHLIVLLIDERPEEVTDIKESIEGPNVEVIYSTFDELPEHHKRVSEMVLERAKRLVEHGRDVMILLDSITRLARAYNLTVAPSGRTLSGGLDPAALHMPKRFFGAARNMREGGSLTILATALVETGSRMDDVVFEEFKGTGNMELMLNRKLSEKRIFPAIDILKSGTRRDDLLLTPEEQTAVEIVRKATGGLKADEAVERVLDLFRHTRSNREFMAMVGKLKV
ncbi:MAG: transcription termination factor Rho [Lachnospiraceae bacterium]|jgi:transcription termination factor Rho|nr:transcription termination factor Rho [Lachnospiraceae bacterium]